MASYIWFVLMKGQGHANQIAHNSCVWLAQSYLLLAPLLLSLGTIYLTLGTNTNWALVQFLWSMALSWLSLGLMFLALGNIEMPLWFNLWVHWPNPDVPLAPFYSPHGTILFFPWHHCSFHWHHPVLPRDYHIVPLVLVHLSLGTIVVSTGTILFFSWDTSGYPSQRAISL